MSTPLAPLPIRLFCDLATPNQLNDLNRNSQPPSFYRGDDIEIDIGIGQSGALLTGLADSGAGGVASVTLQIFAAENDTNSPMIAATVLGSAMNLGLTQTEWTNDTTPFYHAAFVIPGSQTAVSLNGQASVNYWMRITATTSDATPKTITILDGPITVKDGPISTASVPPAAQFRGYVVAGQTVFQLLDTSTGLYHTLAILNEGGGELTLQLSDQGY
jgi:hypothetical protein